MSGAKPGGPADPASITRVSTPWPSSRARTNASSSPLVSSVPTRTTGIGRESSAKGGEPVPGDRGCRLTSAGGVDHHVTHGLEHASPRFGNDFTPESGDSPGASSTGEDEEDHDRP